jgi:transposase
MPTTVRRRYFELIRTGLSGSEAAKRVGVSLSCGSLWFIDAYRVNFIETLVSTAHTASAKITTAGSARPGGAAGQ